MDLGDKQRNQSLNNGGDVENIKTRHEQDILKQIKRGVVQERKRMAQRIDCSGR